MSATKLGSVVRFRTGKLNSNAAVPGGRYPFFTCSQETYQIDTFTFDTECVLLAGNNAAGIYPLKYFKGKFDAYQRTYIVEPKSKLELNTRFLYYSLRLQLERMQSISTGAATKFLTLTILNNIEIDVPPMGQQRRIASILSAYDDLIENNTRRIAILEEMARRIYEEWFVHFRFPGHAQMRMVESELGLIPEGWLPYRLGLLIDIDKGLSYNGKGLTDDGLPMINLKNIFPGGGFRRDGTKPYSGEFKARHTVQSGDIVIANTDLTQAGLVVGSPAIVPTLETEFALYTHHLYAVRAKNSSATRPFIYHLLAHSSFKSFAKGYASGTTVLGLPREGVLNYEFALAPPDLLTTFAEKVGVMQSLSEILNRKIENLRTTRDLLLPKLISGELDVSRLPEEEAICS